MRAMVFYEHGGPDVLQYREDIATPHPRPHEVVVKVRYAALNRLDDFVRQGWRGLELELPHILGADFAGTIAEVGENVTGWRAGQRVTAHPSRWCGVCTACLAGRQQQCERHAIMGEEVPGAFAEFVRVPAINLVAIPDDFPDTLAAAAPLVGVTAWHMLISNGNLRAGEWVLIVGAGGGVNSMALQIAKLAGAIVWVVAGNAEKVRKVTELGADWAIDRTQHPDWSRAVWMESGRRGMDVVVDNVGQDTWGSSLRSLGKGGRLLTVGGTTGYEAATPVNLLFHRHLRIIGSSMGSMADFRAVMAEIWAGKIKPVIDGIYPLVEYPAALTRMQSGEGFGKILLKVA